MTVSARNATLHADAVHHVQGFDSTALDADKATRAAVLSKRRDMRRTPSGRLRTSAKGGR